ncbi:MAG: ComEC family competence protein [Bacteroidales bacterium]|nr:ComEC family competence protein [Bacteroidales bacterium]
MANQVAMFDLRRIPVVKVLIPFAAGAFSGVLITVPISIAGVVILAVLGWISLLTAFLRLYWKPGSVPWLFCLLVFLFCFTTGMGTGLVTRPVDPKLPVGDLVIIRGVVKEAPRPGQQYLTCEMALKMLYAHDTVYPGGTLLKVYLNLPDDSVLPRAGETWQLFGKLTAIRNSGNPGTPDFESIMRRKDCWYRFYSSGPSALELSGRRVSAPVRKFDSDFIRSALSDRWHGHKDERALLKAVCLGDRASLTDDMRQMYGAAGGMHLLAVSGLHVGLIWWVLQHLTQWMVRISRSEVYRTLAVVGILWFYASVTGFSSSVCRSVTMFTFFSAGRMMGQRTHAVNGIFVSALILVAIQPARLLEVGFQLSYAAILGIVSFYPFFRSLFRLKCRLFRWLWNATAVSLAAQLVTAPIVICYFHQLPVYSLVTSLLAVPMLSILIALFTCSVPFMLAGVLEGAFNFMLMGLARLMNLTMEAMAAMPGALLEGLHLSSEMLILWMAILCLLMLAVERRSRFPGYMVLFMISVLLVWSAWTLGYRRRTSEMDICHFRGASMVTIREGDRVDHYCWYRDSSSVGYMQQYRSDVWSRRIYRNLMHEVGDSACFRGSVSECIALDHGVWIVGNDHFGGWVVSGQVNGSQPAKLLYDSAVTGLKSPDFILLSGEPSGLTLKAKPSGSDIDLVMDGSNRSWYRERMHAKWDRIHDTERHGAYVKRW